MAVADHWLTRVSGLVGLAGGTNFPPSLPLVRCVCIPVPAISHCLRACSRSHTPAVERSEQRGGRRRPFHSRPACTQVEPGCLAWSPNHKDAPPLPCHSASATAHPKAIQQWARVRLSGCQTGGSVRGDGMKPEGDEDA